MTPIFFDKKLLRIQKRGLNMPIDRNSPYYKKCRFCSYEFMYTNASTKYCCDKCKDDYDNAEKLIKRQRAQNQAAQSIEQSLDQRTEQRQKNLRILKSYFKIPLEEIIVSLDELNEAGYDFEVYDSLHDMNHPEGTQKRYNAKIATFIMTYYSEQEIHLENLKNKQP